METEKQVKSADYAYHSEGSMLRTVTVKVKSVYGNELIYPVNLSAIIFSELTGKKTFSKRDLDKIRELGFKVECAQNTI